MIKRPYLSHAAIGFCPCDACINQGAYDELNRIVRWLRSPASHKWNGTVAEALEKGEHNR